MLLYVEQDVEGVGARGLRVELGGISAEPSKCLLGSGSVDALQALVQCPMLERRARATSSLRLRVEAIDTPVFDVFCPCVFLALLHASAGSVIDTRAGGAPEHLVATFS